GEVPFSSERMLMATFHRGPDAAEVYVKGAPARVIERCVRLLGPSGEEAPLDDDIRAAVLERNDAMAAGGLRVLALARGAADSAEEGALHDLTLLGLVGMSDPPAAGVLETIARFRAAGIRTVMITGDQRQTAATVA